MFGNLFGKPKPPRPLVHLSHVADIYKQLNYPVPVGCAASDIERLEKTSGQRFPAAYREYLEWMGNGAGQFLDGSQCFFRHALNLRQSASELLQENKFPSTLPRDAVVVWMHQGYQFLFLRAEEGDDPPVHWYHESRHAEKFELNKYPSFSRFIGDELAAHAFLDEAITGVENGIRKLRAEAVSAHVRDNDAEMKLIKDLTEKFAGNKGAKGKVRFLSEARMCIACRFALKQFSDSFPNIRIEVEMPDFEPS